MTAWHPEACLENMQACKLLFCSWKNAVQINTVLGLMVADMTIFKCHINEHHPAKSHVAENERELSKLR